MLQSKFPTIPSPNPTQDPDWIEKLNDLADERAHDDRMLVEIFIMFLDEKKLGDAFIRYYNEPRRL